MIRVKVINKNTTVPVTVGCAPKISVLAYAVGPRGPEGAPGSVWRTGAGVPADALGIDGDYYLNTTNGDVYAKAAGSYSLVTNLANFNDLAKVLAVGNTSGPKSILFDSTYGIDTKPGAITLNIGTSNATGINYGSALTTHRMLGKLQVGRVLLAENNSGITAYDSTGIARTLIDFPGDNIRILGKPGMSDIYIDPTSNTTGMYVKGTNGAVGIGIATPSAKLEVRHATEQLRLGVNVTNYTSFTIGIEGGIIFSSNTVTAGAKTTFTFNLPATTGQNSGNNIPGILINTGSRQYLNGGVALQEEIRITAPVYSHVSGANNINLAATLSVYAPAAGSFTTISNAYAILSTGMVKIDVGTVSGGIQLRARVNNPSVGALYMAQSNPSADNYVLIASGGSSILNAATSVGIACGGLNQLSVNTSGCLMANVAAVPGTPAAGGSLYVEAGSLKYKGSGGTITTIAVP